MKNLTALLASTVLTFTAQTAAADGSDWNYTLHATYESPSKTETKSYDCDLRQREPLACIVKINVGDYLGRIELAQWPHARKYDLYMHGDYDRIAGEKGDTWEYTAWKREGLEPDDLDAIVWRVNHFGEAGRLTLSYRPDGDDGSSGDGSTSWFSGLFSLSDD